MTTVLIVDDDDDMRAYLATCVAGLGDVRVVEAADGREALRLARSLCPDLVVSDVAMPQMDGAALCRALRNDPATTMLPLLLISGETRAPPACADGFLEKPFNAAALRASIHDVLSAPRPPLPVSE